MERKSENIQRAIVQELNNIMVDNDQVVVVNADIALLLKMDQTQSLVRTGCLM